MRLNEHLQDGWDCEAGPTDWQFGDDRDNGDPPVMVAAMDWTCSACGTACQKNDSYPTGNCWKCGEPSAAWETAPAEPYTWEKRLREQDEAMEDDHE